MPSRLLHWFALVGTARQHLLEVPHAESSVGWRNDRCCVWRTVGCANAHVVRARVVPVAREPAHLRVLSHQGQHAHS